MSYVIIQLESCYTCFQIYNVFTLPSHVSVLHIPGVGTKVFPLCPTCKQQAFVQHASVKSTDKSDLRFEEI